MISVGSSVEEKADPGLFDWEKSGWKDREAEG